MSSIFVPKKIRVGFVKREGTYTGKLAYIIYYDEKNKIRKETSWSNWRDHDIEAIELDNIPQCGYILNKGVQRDGYWGSGRSVVRIYDPRDFEFEISVNNLMSILMHSDVSKRDINQECILAWYSGELVLLPTNSVEYQKSLVYTQKQSLSISTKDLVKGATYDFKKTNDKAVYLGYFPTYSLDFIYYHENGYSQSSKGKKHTFYSLENKNYITPSISTIASCINEDIYPDYSTLIEKLDDELDFQPIKDINLINVNFNKKNIDLRELVLKYDDKYYLVNINDYRHMSFNVVGGSEAKQHNFYIGQKLCFESEFSDLYKFISNISDIKTNQIACSTNYYRNYITINFENREKLVEFLDKNKEKMTLHKVQFVFENNHTFNWR